MIDLHYHLSLSPSPRVLNALSKKDLFVLAVTESPSSFEALWNKHKQMPRLRIGLGLHPLLAPRITSSDIERFIRQLEHTNYVGEVGLDFSWVAGDVKAKQIGIFNKITEVLSGKRKLLSIHSRKADREALEILKTNNCKMAVFHWYTGPLRLIPAIVEAGFYFSVNPAMIRSAKGQKALSTMPKERILTETDGPSVKIGNRPAIPTDVSIVERYLSDLWGIDQEVVEQTIKQNLLRLIG